MSNPTASRGWGEWPNCDTASLHEMRTEEKLSMTFYRITLQAVEVNHTQFTYEHHSGKLR
jgi:hypothetical protein